MFEVNIFSKALHSGSRLTVKIEENVHQGKKEGLSIINTAQGFFIQDQYAQLLGKIVPNVIGLYKALGGDRQIRKGKKYLPEETKE